MCAVLAIVCTTHTTTRRCAHSILVALHRYGCGLVLTREAQRVERGWRGIRGAATRRVVDRVLMRERMREREIEIKS
jgi:hypothetical protein